MSYTYHGTTDLVALPNRAVQTFPSGLVRVERSFVCRKSQVAKYRNVIKVNEPMPFDDGAPAIDGLYIFPEPQEVVRDDGFVEFRVTAYGRTNIFSEITVERSSAKGSYFLIITTWDGTQFNSATLSPPSINEIYTFRGVLESSAPVTELVATPKIQNPTIIPFAGQPLSPGVEEFRNQTVFFNNTIFYRFVETQIYVYIDSFSSTNFGRWTEYTVNWQSLASVVDGYRS
jgi:hypothetical protein